MLVERLFPIKSATKSDDLYNLKTSEPAKSIVKALNTKVLGLDFHSGFTAISRTASERANFEEAPYDLDRIIQAVDTDSYVKQAFLKYKELFWKEGFEIVSENNEAAQYLWQRFDVFEEVMGRPFTDFMKEVVDQLVKFSNVFIVESRKDIRPIFPGQLYPPEGKETICGYYIIPTETVKIQRDKFNKPIRYRQSMVTQSYISDASDEPTWEADEVIHLHLDRKPGRAFGTPMIVSVLDDVIALRQMEEDIQNLAHRDLFPLYKYTVGTESMPSTPEEIQQAATEIANLRVEGGIIIPERHDVDVIGGKNAALDIHPYLLEFKQRVAMGLGVYPHHLGIMSAAGNRSATDRLDTALYDKIKELQDYFEGQVRVNIFNRLLREGGYDPLPTPLREGDSDRCYMRFREIDIDTQIKRQTHVVNMWANNIIEFDEARLDLGRIGTVDPRQLLMSLQAQVQTAAQVHVLEATAQLQPVAPATETKTTKSATGASSTTVKTPQAPAPKGLPPAVKKPDGVAPSLGGKPNMPNNKSAANAMRPANQFGRRNSPNVRHMDNDYLNDIIELLEEKDNINE